ncbi:YbaB/EbfC family nucleoid-associated protein [Nocardia sp. NPDC051570]|uniref:YbaB/EbfC family nucleoid-associated protein n=1 Tax=Nocardia sp. NPDC051570 TaxID=3364324 RepID=UPI0037BC31BC
MENRERDEIRSANAGLHSALDALHTAYEQELEQLSAISQKLAEMKVRATSPTNLARVTVNSTGLVLEVSIAEDAYRRSTPTQLTEELNTTIRGAVEAAAKARKELLAPVQSVADGIADLSETIPGAPSLRQVEHQLSDEPPTPQ